MLANLSRTIIGTAKFFTLEQRIHNTISIVVGVLSFPMLILDTFLDLQLIHKLSIVFCGVSNLTFYYLSRFRRKTFSFVPLAILLITLSVIWLGGYGLNGFVNLFLLALAVPTAILLRGADALRARGKCAFSSGAAPQGTEYDCASCPTVGH